MPIYEYRRPDGSTFEVLQSFADEPLERDPQTGAPIERVLHAPAVHFKGKGFYNTDYGTRKRQRETTSPTDATSPASNDGSSGASADSSASSEKKEPAAAAKPAKAAGPSTG